MLDTNVVLHDAEAIFRFDEHQVVIPIHVIEEVDQFKKELSERGRCARQLSRNLDELREEHGGSLQNGVPLKSGGMLLIFAPTVKEWKRPKKSEMDHAIMSVALKLRDTEKSADVVFVTMDSNLRIRADALGLAAENYEGGRIVRDELYSGILRLDVDSSLVDILGKKEPVGGDLLKDALTPDGEAFEFFANAGVLLRDKAAPKHTAIGRFDVETNEVHPLRVDRHGIWGVRPRNVEQLLAMDLLLNPDIDLVTLVGKAGTGKTLLAIAAGLQGVVEAGSHSKLLVSRPIFPMGRDIGFLPGTVEEKLNPWMQPIFDNLEYIFSTGRGRMSDSRDYHELVSAGTIQIEPLTYIRGRSLPNQWMIIDEAQNLTPHEIKTVITRCGTGTKIILTGDPYQIDNPYVDAASNGLTVVAQAFRNQTLAAHVTLSKGERSELAEKATELL